jgi:DNA-binding beta-propeller fold protein YncE
MRASTTWLSLFAVLFALVGCIAPPAGDNADQATPAAPPDAAEASDSFILYVQPNFAPWLTPLDPVTLQDAHDHAQFRLDGVGEMEQAEFIVSPDGATVVALIGDQVRVLDGYSGEVRAQFPRPENEMIDEVSPDGTRLAGRWVVEAGKQAWTVLSAENGEPLVRGEGDYAIFDWENDRVYSLERPNTLTSPEPVEPQPVVLLVSDLATGGVLDRLTLDDVLAGLYVPSMALTPDGRQLLLLHTDSATITLVDLDQLQVVATHAIQGDQDTAASGTAFYGGDMQLAPDGKLYIVGHAQEPSADPAEMRQRNVYRIDGEYARVEAVTSIEGDWVYWFVAPDGSAIYSFSNGSEELQSSNGPPQTTMLIRRLDLRTLKVTAERELDGFHRGYIVVEPAVSGE